MAEDRRVTRTRHALLSAFNHLVLNRRQRHIRVGDIVDEAGVGRSTFYEHYSSAEALQIEALKGPFTPLAEAAAGQGQAAALEAILRHFWDFRQRAQKTLTDRAERVLVEMIEERLGNDPLALPKRLAARQMASAALAPVTAWLKGESPCTAEELAHSICNSGRAIRHALSCRD